MIILFVLLGLAFLVGGVGAIVDGWPYLVLERGFTQVIIGTVAATAGIILLALAWVLTELRRIRTALRAMTLLSAASLPGEAAVRTFDEERGPSLPEPAVRGPEARLPGLGTVAAGAGVAAAGGALATVFADRGIGQHQEADEKTLPPDEPAPVAQNDDAQDENGPVSPAPAADDVFDEALIDVAATGRSADEPPAASEEEPAKTEAAPGEEAKEREEQPAGDWPYDVAPDDIPAAGAGDEPVAERDDEVRAEPEAEPEPAKEAEPAPEPETAVEAEPVTPPEPREESKRSTWWPRFGSRASEPAAEPRIVEADDLTALRQRLTLGPQPPAQPAEPEEEAAGERRGEPDLGAAEAWIAPASGRREPSFDEPASVEPTPEPEEQAEPETPAVDEQHDEEPHVEAADEQPAADEAETPADEPSAEPPRPAASEEGIVGAYQVGDTHFTMYADGSIKARTPEGEYSFASMDELKTYLASEKSRLGV